MAFGVAFDDLCEMFRADGLCQTGAPEFGLVGAEQAIAHFVDGEAMPTLPRFRALFEQGVFDGERLGGFYESVDAGGVGIEHRAGFEAGGLVV